MRHDDGRVVPTFIKQALMNQPLSVSVVTKRVHFAIVVIWLSLDALMNNEESTGPFNLGNPHELTMLSWPKKINRIIGNTAGVVHKPLPPNDPTRRRP